MPPGVAGRGGIKQAFVPKVKKKLFYALSWALVASVAGRGGHKTSFCVESDEKVVLCPPGVAGGQRPGGDIKQLFSNIGTQKMV